MAIMVCMPALAHDRICGSALPEGSYFAQISSAQMNGEKFSNIFTKWFVLFRIFFHPGHIAEIMNAGEGTLENRLNVSVVYYRLNL